MSEKIEVFSSGGGTQSCAIAALIVQGRLPKPDFAVIADTTLERSTTWTYLEQYVAPALASVGVQMHRVCKSDYAYKHDGVFNGKGTLLIPAYTNQSGTPGKMSGFCSKWWKSEARNNWLRRVHGLKREQFRVWIGFSVDEMPRALRMMKGEEWQQGLIRLPLINDVPMRREQSIRLVESMGWPTPPRSNCYMCPNQSDAEWRDLKQNSPDEFRKAVELEREIQKRDPFAWFHKSCIPLDQVDFSEPEDLFSRPCESGACFI